MTTPCKCQEFSEMRLKWSKVRLITEEVDAVVCDNCRVIIQEFRYGKPE